MTSKEKCIETLEKFKILLDKYNNTNNLSIQQKLRSNINQEKHLVELIVKKARTSKLISILPPPALGGYSYENINPFNIIFNPPYGYNIIDTIIDCIDEAIGAISIKEDFTLENPIQEKLSISNLANENKGVFVVHGHDNEIKEQVASFLLKLRLNPIILHEQASSGKTIIEKIEEYSNVGFGIVLYTPCDIGAKKGEESNLKNRARQNVVFEHGYLIGKIGRSNVCALLKGNIETPNDISGVVYVSLDDNWKLNLAKELKNSSYDIDMNLAI